MENQIKDYLEQLFELREGIVEVNALWDEKEFSLIPEDLRKELESLKGQREISLATLLLNETSLTKKVKSLNVQHESSVKGEDLSAIFNKGRVTWDSKGLEGFMVAHPEIEAFRKVGKAYCTIRKVKK